MTSPRWARALLRLALEADVADDRIGDLEEVHRRRLARHGRWAAHLLTGAEAVGLATAGLRHRVTLPVGRVELRLALRLLLKTPLLSATATVALAVGIALATVGFTLVEAAFDPRLPFPDGDRVVDVTLADPRTRETMPPDPRLVAAWRDGAPSVSHLGLARDFRVNVAYGPADIELLRALEVTPGSLAALGFAPLAGRSLSPSDAAPGAEPVIILGQALWSRRFAGNPAVVGTTLDVAGTPRRIVGVLPETAVVPADADVWIPAELDSTAGARVFALLAPGAAPGAAEAQLTALAAAWAADTPGAVAPRVEVRRPGDVPEGRAAGALAMALLLGLLAVMAGNVGSLVAARTAARRGELTVRTALGASRTRLVGQLTVEVAVLVAVAAGIGVAAARLVLSGFMASEGDELPAWMDLSPDLALVGFVVVLALAVTFLAGVWPALRATRSDEGSGLRGGGRPFGRRHDALIVVQVGLAVAVLGCATMIHRGWTGAHAGGDPDVPVDRLVVAEMVLPAGPDGRPAPPSVALIDRLSALPGVVGVGLSTHVPGTDAPRGAFEVEGGAGTPVTAGRIRVGEGYFAAVGAAPITGRLPDDVSPGGAPPREAVVDETFVRTHLGGGNAVGHRIRPRSDDSSAPWAVVVGVVPDLGVSGADPRPIGAVYLPLERADAIYALLRVDSGTGSWEPWVRGAVFDVDPSAVVQSVALLGASLEARRRVYRWMGSVVTGAGALVLALALLATYALLAFEVTRRTREVGVRVALGASQGAVLGPLLTRTARWVGLGILTGTVVGFALLALVRATLVMRFPPTGLLTFPLLGLGVAVAALAAAWVPARRALAIQPMDALRAE